MNSHISTLEQSFQAKGIPTDLLPDWFFKTGTAEQVAAILQLHHPSFKNMVVEALAGCGKTTLLKLILATLKGRQRVLFTSFSREVVDSFSKSGVETSPDVNLVTAGVHSLGLRAIRDNIRRHLYNNRAVGSPEAVDKILKSVFSSGFVDKDKYVKILQEYWKDYSDRLWESMNEEERESADFKKIKRNILRLVNLGRLYAKTKLEELNELAARVGIYQEGRGDLREALMARRIILDGLGKSSASALETIDFTDMLWFPYAMDRLGRHRKAKRNQTYHIWEFPAFDYILVDECQDLSTLQLDLIRKMNPRHQISVGDPNQAIYGFAGSDYESFQNITLIPGTEVLPLTINFRSTEKIGDKVRELVPAFKTAPICDEGVDPRASGFNDIQLGDCIIARNNKPLIEIYFEIMKLSLTSKRYLPVYIKGNVFDKADEAIAEAASHRCRSSLTHSVVREIRKIHEEGVTRLTAQGIDAEQAAKTDDMKKLEMLADTLEVIVKIQPSKAKTYKNAFKEAKELTQKMGKDAICLCTAHRSKGLEFDRVHIYGRDSFMKERDDATEEQIRQEKNLYYVAISRAKKELMFLIDINSWDVQSVKEQTPSLGKYGDNLEEVI